MSMLKGNYKLAKEPVPQPEQECPADNVLEQDYYKAAMSKLGGSISFVMKDKVFLWKGDPVTSGEDSAVKTDAAGERK